MKLFSIVLGLLILASCGKTAMSPEEYNDKLMAAKTAVDNAKKVHADKKQELDRMIATRIAVSKADKGGVQTREAVLQKELSQLEADLKQKQQSLEALEKQGPPIRRF